MDLNSFKQKYGGSPVKTGGAGMGLDSFRVKYGGADYAKSARENDEKRKKREAEMRAQEQQVMSKPEPIQSKPVDQIEHEQKPSFFKRVGSALKEGFATLGEELTGTSDPERDRTMKIARSEYDKNTGKTIDYDKNGQVIPEYKPKAWEEQSFLEKSEATRKEVMQRGLGTPLLGLTKGVVGSVGVAGGVMDTAQKLSPMAQILGKTDNPIANELMDISKKLKTENLDYFAPKSYDANDNVFQNPKLLMNPEYIVRAVSEQVPNLITMMATGGFGEGAIELGSYMQGRREEKGTTTTKDALVSGVVGVINGALGRWGFKGVFEGNPVLGKFVLNRMEKGALKIITEAGISTAGEMGSEYLQELVPSIATKLIYDEGGTWKEVLAEANKQGLSAASQAGIVSAPIAVATEMGRSRESGERARMNDESVEGMKIQYSESNIMTPEGIVSPKLIEGRVSDVAAKLEKNASPEIADQYRAEMQGKQFASYDEFQNANSEITSKLGFENITAPAVVEEGATEAPKENRNVSDMVEALSTDNKEMAAQIAPNLTREELSDATDVLDRAYQAAGEDMKPAIVNDIAYLTNLSRERLDKIQNVAGEVIAKKTTENLDNDIEGLNASEVNEVNELIDRAKEITKEKYPSITNVNAQSVEKANADIADLQTQKKELLAKKSQVKESPEAAKEIQATIDEVDKKINSLKDFVRLPVRGEQQSEMPTQNEVARSVNPNTGAIIFRINGREYSWRKPVQGDSNSGFLQMKNKEGILMVRSEKQVKSEKEALALVQKENQKKEKTNEKNIARADIKAGQTIRVFDATGKEHAIGVVSKVDEKGITIKNEETGLPFRYNDSFEFRAVEKTQKEQVADKEGRKTSLIEKSQKAVEEHIKPRIKKALEETTAQKGKGTPAIKALKAVITKSSLPILENVRVKDGKIYATDLSVGLVLNTDLKNGIYKVVGNDFVSDKDRIDEKDFPEIPNIEEKKAIGKSTTENVVKALKVLINSVDKNYTRPELAGVSFKFDKGRIEMVATDSFRLTVKKIGAKLYKETANFILGDPKKMSQVMEAVGGMVEIREDKDFVGFYGENGYAIVKKIEGKYPEYSQIYPNFKTQYILDKTQLKDALKQLKPYMDYTGQISVDLTKDKKSFVLSTESEKTGKKEVNVDFNKKEISSIVGETLEGTLLMPVRGELVNKTSNVGIFKHKFLEGMLKTLEGDMVYMSVVGKENPFHFSDTNVMNEKRVGENVALEDKEADVVASLKNNKADAILSEAEMAGIIEAIQKETNPSIRKLLQFEVFTKLVDKLGNDLGGYFDAETMTIALNRSLTKIEVENVLREEIGHLATFLLGKEGQSKILDYYDSLSEEDLVSIFGKDTLEAYRKKYKNNRLKMADEAVQWSLRNKDFYTKSPVLRTIRNVIKQLIILWNKINDRFRKEIIRFNAFDVYKDIFSSTGGEQFERSQGYLEELKQKGHRAESIKFVDKNSDTPNKLSDLMSITTLPEMQAINVPLEDINIDEEVFTAMNDVESGRESESYLPILLEKRANGTYDIIDGRHRLAKDMREGKRNFMAMTDEPLYRRYAEREEAAKGKITVRAHTRAGIPVREYERMGSIMPEKPKTKAELYAESFADRYGYKPAATNHLQGFIDYKEEIAENMGGMEHVYPLELPEMVGLAKSLTGKYPIIKRSMRALGYAYSGSLDIKLVAGLFAQGSIKEAKAVLAHELGHIADYLPEGFSGGGNLLSRVANLTRNLKNRLEEAPEFSNKEMRTELKALSAYWRPVENRTAKMDSSSELYADAFSVLFNSPALLQEKAPMFTQALFEFLDRKPEVKSEFFAVQELLGGSRVEIVKQRQADLRRGFAKAEKILEKKMSDRKNADKRLWERLRQQLDDVHYPIIKKQQEKEAAGQIFQDEKNPRFLLEELPFMDNENYLLLDDIHRNAVQPLELAGITMDDIGEYMTLKRIINGRKDIANPYGFTPESAVEQMDYLKESIGEDKFNLIEEKLQYFHELAYKSVEEAVKVGSYNEEVFKEVIEPNKESYAAFRVVDYIDENMPATIKKQVGTFKEIANPFTATILKTVALNRLNNYQRAKRATIEMLGNEAEKSRTITTDGKLKIFKVAKGKGGLEVLENGKLVSYDVDPYIAESFEKVSIAELNAVIKAIDIFNNRFFKPVVTTYNMGFALAFNPVRDFKRNYKNIGKATVFGLMKAYFQSIPSAYKYAKGNLDEFTRMLVENKAINAPIYDYNFDPREDEFGKIMEKYGLFKSAEKVDKLPSIVRKTVVKGAIKILEIMRLAANTFEIVSKVAGTKVRMKQGESGSSLYYNIRNFTGTPNWTRKGKHTQTTNALFVFSNIMKEGLKSDYIIATSPNTRKGYWWKTIKVDLMPKLLMFGAQAGLLGLLTKGDDDDWLKRFYAGVTEYDKTNYIIIPLGINEDGKSVYMRIPHDESGRLISAVAWKMMNFVKDKDPKGLSEIFALGAGQLPNLSPAISIPISWVEYLSGKNPYDWFRGRSIIDDTTFNAGGMRALTKMLKWTSNSLGVSTFATFDTSTQSGVETFFQLTPFFNRLFKISDYGKTEQEYKELDKTTKANAQKLLLRREVITEEVKKGTSTEDILSRLEKELQLDPEAKDYNTKINQYEKEIEQQKEKMKGNSTTNLLLKVQRNADKIRILKKYKEQVSEEEFYNYLNELYDSRIVSDAVYEEL